MEDIYIMKQEKTFTPPHRFISITLLSVLFSVFWLIKTHGSCLDVVVSASGNDRFMDFFNHITYARDRRQLYFSGMHACFPPFIYMMYYLFSKMLPADATVFDPFAISSYALLLYVIYCVVLGILFFYSIYKLLREKGLEFTLLITLLTVFSNIFIFGPIERGNSALIVCILLLLAMALKDHSNKVVREAALIFIAIAAAIKIYPAVYGFLYLFEKRWKEACKLIVYGLLCFFLPFVFFGGADGFLQFFQNQSAVQLGDYRGMGSILSFWNITAVDHLHLGKSAGIMMDILYVLIAIPGSALVKELWKKTLLLSSIMILAPFWSGRYTAIYLVIPLILFLAKEQYKTVDYLYAFLFACMFLFLTYTNAKVAETTSVQLPFLIEYSSLYLMNILLIAEAVTGFIKKRCG